MTGYRQRTGLGHKGMTGIKKSRPGTEETGPDAAHFRIAVGLQRLEHLIGDAAAALFGAMPLRELKARLRRRGN